MARGKKNVATDEEYNVPDAPLDPVADGIVVVDEGTGAESEKTEKED